MNPKFNYLSLLSLLALPAFLIFFEDDLSSLVFSFLYLLYLGYLKIPMDELFIKRIQQAASITLLITVLTMTGYLFSLLFISNVEVLIFGGFWIIFSMVHILFNGILSAFEIYDLRANKL
jgi:hypothetical protein